MPGTIIFKPIEANITIKDQDILGKMDPYCIFHVGHNKIKGSVCKSGGNHPVWNDEIPIDIKDQSICMVEVKDKDMLIDEKLGTFEVDLREIESQGKIRKWFPLFHKEKPAGEVLLEAFLPSRLASQGFSQGIGQQGLNQPNLSSQGLNQGVYQQGLNQPSLSSQGLNQGGYQQGLNQPGLSSQGLNQGISQQGLNQPILSSQGLNQGGYQQGLNQPNLSSQGLNQGVYQQGLNQPGLSSQGISQGYPQQGLYQGLNKPGFSSQGLSQGLPQQTVSQMLPQQGVYQPGQFSQPSAPLSFAEEALLRGTDPTNLQQKLAYNASQSQGMPTQSLYGSGQLLNQSSNIVRTDELIYEGDVNRFNHPPTQMPFGHGHHTSQDPLNPQKKI